MTEIATPSVTTPSVIETILTDTRWTVHDGLAPAGTVPPFISYTLDPPILRGRAQAVECGPRLDDVWRFSCFGGTVAQAQWLRDQLLGAPWPVGWRIVLPPTISRDDTAVPEWWLASVLMTLEPV